MNVNLRKRKQGKSNKVALYLDIYKGRTVDANGKTKYLRTYEHLNMFIYDNPKTNSDKLHNKKIMQIAKNIKNKRELEIYSGRYGIKTDTDCKNTNFYEYYCGLAENYKLESSCWRSWKSSCQILKEFAGENITFAEIDENFCERYLRHIQNKTSMHNRSLKNTSINYYFRRFVYAIKCAVKDKIIKENPATNVKLLKVKKTEPVYLTFEELQTLIKTDCKDSLLKRMFIFSCLTGLRWGDVYKLTWSEIEETQGKCSIVFKQQKTQETNYLPLSEQALSCMGDRGLDDEKVFESRSYDNFVNHQIRVWVKSADINKKITYHSSRHTFAVLQLSLKTPIFTVQKLLGHTNISSTMRYANIIDDKKEEAMNKIGSVFTL